ncbi:E3 ubiquitin-protein ligase MARCHF2 isoform X3 [Petaurus breviceps papuanus]|uniref:E3 ubiquitin-protein ligase MARCHF2 isoform X3 n=1 Tax=Petaurus breviceps papuanus TaxID=3040969 RepID=UPI0036DECEB7
MTALYAPPPGGGGSLPWASIGPRHASDCLHWPQGLSVGTEGRPGPGRRTKGCRAGPGAESRQELTGRAGAAAAAAALSGALGGTARPGPARGTSDGPICRICHEGSSGEVLLSPCDCTGTLGTVHKSCLEKWLSSSNTSYCELCHTEFVVERRPRPLTEVSFRYHCQLYSEWRRTNQKVRLMILDSESCKTAQHSLLSAMFLKKTAEETTV